jgi:hypothetical protein
MKNLIFICLVLFIYPLCIFSQNTEISGELNGVKVYTMEGWIIKAINSTGVTHKYSFSYVTEGKNSNGDIVSTTTDTFGPATINANEEKQLFTAPQDPNKKITYKFTSIQMLTSESVSSSGGGRPRIK